MRTAIWSSARDVTRFAFAARQNVPATALAPHAQQMTGLVADLLPGLAADIDAGRFSGTESASLTSVTASLDQHSVDVGVLTDGEPHANALPCPPVSCSVRSAT